jgi:hypothetical protein
MARVLALDKGTEFGMIYPEKFKGSNFMNLDMGIPVKDLLYDYAEKSEKNEAGNEVRDYDWTGVNSIKDFTLIDGYWQGEKYYQHHLDKMREWLKVESQDMPNDLCVISFRGGEYVGVPDLFLPKEYWRKAIEIMRLKYFHIKFEVQTDDIETAKEFFPDFKVIHDVGYNWKAIRYAKHLIVSNSSFHILPSLLGNAKEIIAPKYHAGYNKGYWQLKQNQYDKFIYI